MDAVSLLAGEGGVWSSTYIRGLIRAGDVASASYSLGRPHRVEGTVVHGDHRGRELGYPTANLATTPHAAIPADGVYAARLVLDPYTDAEVVAAGRGVASAPTRPSTASSAASRPTCSTATTSTSTARHVALDFVARIRGQEKFDDVDALVAQMAVDVDEARRLPADARRAAGPPSAGSSGADCRCSSRTTRRAATCGPAPCPRCSSCSC